MSATVDGILERLSERPGMADSPGNFLGELDKTLKRAIDESKALPADEQAALALQCAAGAGDLAQFGSVKLLSALLRRKLAFSDAQLADLIRSACQWPWGGPAGSILGHVERLGPGDETLEALAALKAAPYVAEDSYEARKTRERIDKLLAGPQPSKPFQPCGAWSRELLESASGVERTLLERLLMLGEEMSGAAPSRKWREQAAAIVAEVDSRRFREIALAALERGPNPGEQAPVTPEEGDLQKGLIWALVAYSDREVCAALARFAELGLKKIPQLGPVAQKSANACIKTLAAMPGTDAVAQLSRLAIRVKYATTRRILEQAIDEAAKCNGWTREQLAEVTVPDYNLSPEGVFAQRLGEYAAEFDIRSTTPRFADREGKRIKSLPQEVRREHAGEPKASRARAKEMEEMLVRAMRLERLLSSERRMPLAHWRKWYVEHPLVQDLARRLIWEFSFDGATRSGIRRDGRLLEWNGGELSVPEDATVRLWHPLSSEAQTVLSWRCWLEDNGVQQPFKQAHREVYVLTDAGTGDGAAFQSLRGAHSAAASVRGAVPAAQPAVPLMGAWDRTTRRIDLPDAGMQAQLFVDFAAEDEVTAHYVYQYIATDQVRFVETESQTPIPTQEHSAAGVQRSDA